MELHIVRTKGVECFPKIFQVIFFSLAFHQYVVLIDLDISPNLLCEHLVHEGYVAPAFLRLNGITLYEEALASDKWSLLLIYFVHSNLVVTRKSIHEA